MEPPLTHSKLPCRAAYPSITVVRGGSVWSNHPELTRNCPAGLFPQTQPLFYIDHTHSYITSFYGSCLLWLIHVCVIIIGERERAYLVVQTARFFCILYIYPALMYAVMFYVILNKRKLHFPLAKNVMHSPSIYTYVLSLLLPSRRLYRTLLNHIFKVCRVPIH